MADIDIQPSALTDFARNTQLDLDPGSLQALASTASSGQSQLAKGAEFFETQRASIQLVMAFFQEARLGNRAYRDGADAIATLYTTTDDRLSATIQAVTRSESSAGSSPLPVPQQA